MGQSSMSNPYPAQFDLILPTAIVCSFSFFNVWFNIVQLISAVFPFPLPFGIPSPSDGLLVVCIG